MRIYVLNLRKVFKYSLALLIIIGLILIVGISTPKVLGAFAEERELPIYSVDYPEKKVAITFDCAWEADDIPDILETLRNEGIKATFFIVGQWAERYPETIKMISQEGHDIANHSHSHFRMGTLDKAKIKQEITMCGDKLSELSGQKVDLFRAPYGDYNNNVVKGAKDIGYYTIQWDVDSLDWKPGISQAEILNRVMKKVRNGSIILFHNDTTHTAKMLPTIVSSLKKEGYGFLPVSQMIYKDKYYIDHEGRQKVQNDQKNTM